MDSIIGTKTLMPADKSLLALAHLNIGIMYCECINLTHNGNMHIEECIKLFENTKPFFKNIVILIRELQFCYNMS